jgi:hypothetical protein
MASSLSVSAPSSDPGKVLVVNLERNRQTRTGPADLSVANPVEF